MPFLTVPCSWALGWQISELKAQSHEFSQLPNMGAKDEGSPFLGPGKESPEDGDLPQAHARE